MARTAVAVLAAVLLAPSAAASPDEDLFPLAPGNRWILRDLELGSTRTTVVLRDARGLVLRGFPGAGDLRVRTFGEAVQAWDGAQGRWETFLRLGAPRGTKYAVDLTGVPPWESAVVSVASKRAVARGASGRVYRGCTRLTFTYRKGLADAGLTELVFAPGVGLVRSTVITIAGPRTSALASVRLRSS